MSYRAQAAILLCAALIASSAAANTIELSQHVPHAKSELGASVQEMARKLKTEYREPDPTTYLDNLFRLELIVGDYRKADDALAAWGSAQRAQQRSTLADLKWLIYVRAKLLQQKMHVPFERAFTETAERELRQLTAKDAYAAIYSFETPLNVLARGFGEGALK